MLASFSAHIANTSMQRGMDQHEVGTGLADFCTIEQGGDVLRRCVFASELQAVRHCGETNAVAVEAILNTLLHFFGQLMTHRILVHVPFPFPRLTNNQRFEISIEINFP
jgi:hypothetical protein